MVVLLLGDAQQRYNTPHEWFPWGYHCCRVPMRDSSSWWVHAFFYFYSLISSLRRANFSCGSRSFCCIVSISIPSNVKVVLGLSCFSLASGMHSSLHVLARMSRYSNLEDQLLRSHPNSDICSPLPPLPPPTRAHQLSNWRFWEQIRDQMAACSLCRLGPSISSPSISSPAIYCLVVGPAPACRQLWYLSWLGVLFAKGDGSVCYVTDRNINLRAGALVNHVIDTLSLCVQEICD